MQNNSTRALLVVLAIIGILGLVGIIVGHVIVTLIRAMPLLLGAAVIYYLFIRKKRNDPF